MGFTQVKSARTLLYRALDTLRDEMAGKGATIPYFEIVRGLALLMAASF